MAELRDKMEADLKIAGYSPRTRKIYLLYARQFARFHMRSPTEMGAQEIRRSADRERVFLAGSQSWTPAVARSSATASTARSLD